MNRSDREKRRLTKHRWQQVRRQIGQVLWEKWDPIGVNDTPEAYGEYDDYINSVMKLLMEGADDQKIVARLHQHETVDMGLCGSSNERLLSVFAELREIDVGLLS